MNWLKIIPLVGSVIGLVERFVNKPQPPAPAPAPEDKSAAARAKARWMNRDR